MAHAMLSFNEQIERIAEVVAVIAVGTLLWAVDWQRASWPFVALLLLVIRPLSTSLSQPEASLCAMTWPPSTAWVRSALPLNGMWFRVTLALPASSSMGNGAGASL